MAKNNGFVKLEGTLDNLTFFRKNGQNFVKTKSAVTKARIMSDRRFRRTRENMREFGGAAKASKSFRSAFAGSMQKFADSYVSSRLTGLMKSIVDMGDGKRGERDILISDHADTLKGFNFDPSELFSSRFYQIVQLPVITVERNAVSWGISSFNPDGVINAPEGATHFKMVLAAGYVSNYSFNSIDERYEPVEVDFDGTGGNVYSDALKLDEPTPDVTSLNLVLSAEEEVPDEVTVFVSVGIVFYQEVNAELYEFAEGGAMKVVVTG